MIPAELVSMSRRHATDHRSASDRLYKYRITRHHHHRGLPAYHFPTSSFRSNANELYARDAINWLPQQYMTAIRPTLGLSSRPTTRTSFNTKLPWKLSVDFYCVMFYPAFDCLSVWCLFVSWQLHVKTTDGIFIKIFAGGVHLDKEVSIKFRKSESALTEVCAPQL